MAKKDKSERNEKEGIRAIAKRKAPLPAKVSRSFTVGELEQALLKEFPAEDAESWDRTGLQVGERALPVTGVAVALDATVYAIRAAAMAGANVLITHHPPYLEAPDTFAPEPSVALNPGAVIWAAIQNQVACMDFHTALDVSAKAQRALPAMLGLAYKGKVLSPIATSKKKGYGQVCKTTDASGKTLAHLAARCVSVSGRSPRVWGSYDTKIETVVTATGSAGNLGALCLAEGADCLICGEIKYHDALALHDAGLCIIDLGHDVSELPLVAVLAETLGSIGIPNNEITIIDQSANWSIPEAIRV